MKKVLYFMLPDCPHCKLANQLLDRLLKEPQFAEVQIERVNEREQSERAAQYDYYYVPTFYVDGQKVHEGHAEEEDVLRVLKAAVKA